MAAQGLGHVLLGRALRVNEPKREPVREPFGLAQPERDSVGVASRQPEYVAEYITDHAVEGTDGSRHAHAGTD